jgi:glucosamine--fructose-6-phosphate aminotransferase (isomerizing)
VLAHLVEASREATLEGRVAEALRWVEGTYGIVVMSSAEPGKLVVARKGSPVLIGLGVNEFYVASDPSAVLEHTRSVVYLDDGDMAVVTTDGYRIIDAKLRTRVRSVNEIDWAPEAIERGGYAHFMLKEIFEQPASVRNTMRGRLLVEDASIRLNGLRLDAATCAQLERIVIVACGTSWHSGIIGRVMLEQLTGLPVQVEYGSEYRYQTQLRLPNTLVVAISQSGETADTLEAMRAGREAGGRVVGVVNVVGSTIAREAEGGVYLHAGPEIGVASTKAFTSQVTALAMVALYIGRARGLNAGRAQALIHELQRIPELIERTLELEPRVREVAEIYANARNALYLGRGVNFPVALEGALKLKEISYIHAEGLPAAEMKHGPIALIDANMPVVFVAPKDHVYEKVVSNIQEVKARGGRIIVVASQGNGDLSRLADHVLEVPATESLLSPLVTVVPLQLLAYHVAVLRGCDVDRPRNLAKSVTVE